MKECLVLLFLYMSFQTDYSYMEITGFGDKEQTWRTEEESDILAWILCWNPFYLNLLVLMVMV